MEVLERNLKTDMHAPPLYEEGGIYALVGSTGVGKTTTTAKLAAMCARIHGPGSVGLITLDTYRVGAHEQLRTYGRMLGIVAHLAHDRAALQDLLGLLSGKKMVLIDTTGVAPRDPRKRDMLDVLDLPHVNRLLVLNAGCHGDTLDDTLAAFKTDGSQQAILSKVDEAVKLGPAIDALIRHQMVLRGVTNGQRVPEDWEAADAHQLISTSMRAPARSAFDPKATDLNFFFSHSPDPMTFERGWSMLDTQLSPRRQPAQPHARGSNCACWPWPARATGWPGDGNPLAGVRQPAAPGLPGGGARRHRPGEPTKPPACSTCWPQAPWNDGSLPWSGCARLVAGGAAGASKGYAQLAAHAHARLHSPLQALQPLFRQYALIVVYASVATLSTPLLKGTATAPLLLMQPGKPAWSPATSSSSSWHCTPGWPAPWPALPHSATARRRRRKAIAHCIPAANAPSATWAADCAPPPSAGNSPQDMQRLALQLLENAGTINASGMGTALPSLASAGFSSPIVQSH